MIVTMTVNKGVRPHLATVAKDDKIWFPTVFAKSRYHNEIRYGDFKNHSPGEGWCNFEWLRRHQSS